MAHIFKIKNLSQASFKGEVILKLFFILYCVVLLFPNFTNGNDWFNTVFLGLDPSWRIALQYAYDQNLTYGKDIMFTYGPLGYLSNPHNLFAPKIDHVLFGIFQLVYLLIACNVIFNKFKKNSLIDWILILASVPIASFLLDSPTFFILFFSFFFLFHSIHTLNPWHLILAYLGSIVCFYSKIDSGFPLLLAMLAGFLLFFIKSKRPKQNLKLAIFFIVAFIVSIFIFNVDIVGYLVGSYQIIKGYNVAMSTFLLERQLYFYEISKYIYILFLLSVALLFAFNLRGKKINYFILLQIVILLGLSFVFYKKGITRMGIGSLIYAIRGIAIVSLLFALFIAKNIWLKYIFVFQFFIFNLIIPYNSYYKNIGHLLIRNKSNIQNINKDIKFKEYIPRDSIIWAFSNLENQIGIDSLSNINFSDVNSQQEEVVFLKRLENAVKRNGRIARFSRTFNELRHLTQRIYLPNDIRKKLQGKTVDVFGSNIHYAYYNLLNFKGRPIFQSYAAYTPFLDAANAAVLNENSQSPADYILWDCFHAVDKRYKYWQSPLTTKAVLENYQYEELVYPKNVEYKILLKRRDRPKKIFSNEIYKTDTFEINQLYNLPVVNNKLLTANIKVNETIFYKIYKLLYKVKPFHIKLYLEDGSTKRYKIIPDIINNGVIINKYIMSNIKYQENALMQNNFWLLSNITSIEIIGDPKYFGNKISIEIFN